MSSSEKPLPEDFDIQKEIQKVLDSPEWTGYAMPYPQKVMRFVRAAVILEKLFPISENVNRVLTEPKPFHADCGGSIDIFCDTAAYAFAVFQNPDAISLVTDFLSQVDSFSITAERDTRNRPMLVICWSIFDVFQK